MSNCLDCKPGFWGNPSVPARPRGYYRTLWQAQDAMGCSRRLYPSAAADCAGFVEKHDNWTPYDLDKVFTKMAGTPFYAHAENLVEGNGLTPCNFALTYAPYYGIYFPNYTWWVNFRNLGSGNPVVCLMAKIVGGNLTWFDLRDMSNFRACLDSRPQYGMAVGAALLVAQPDHWGNPWLNSI